ncbi:PREDICTED: DNA replication ATP-dependent helicase/nuclease DNA2-like [Acropora digitifera]|uniref:DNA replication ATP-dependent helicase/nuclease DNA2-like n=1 Tax=Acropora digitifera TaxID=70779 RepID=UPI00077A743B|nr:PREDICTED: DNA replication ATP-dependent helicase/nuclease DNA2-like [Acropora digitifera]
MVICGDFNYPKISWDAPDSSTGVNEQEFVEVLHDHYLSQIQRKPTRGTSVLDLAITSVPDQTSMSEVLEIDKAGLFTDHRTVFFEFHTSVKASVKMHRSVYDYAKGDFDSLRNALRSVNLTSMVGEGDLESCWQTWKDLFLAAVKDNISQNRNQATPDPAKEAIVKELNSDQRKAIFKALCARHYALILGMPGTGKTTTISCLVRLLVACGKSVLLTSYTHTAVDNILLKLKEANVDFLRLGQVHKILPELHSHSSQMAAADIKTVDALRQLYESKSVVATTCLGVNHALFSHRMFDYCIVDEASQITQPVCIGPLRRSRVFILVGDHYQLPPLVQSVEAREGGMDVSLFKRLSEQHPHAVVSLEHQYRMNQDIMELSNTLIYENRLKCGTQEVARAQLQLPNWDELVSFVKDTTSNATGGRVFSQLSIST